MMSVKSFITLWFLSFSLVCASSSSPTVISTIPSITEAIFYLEGQDHLVGVTPFCNYPSEAKSITKIGSAFSLNIEKIARIRPDMIFLAKMQGNANEKILSKLGIKYELFEYSRITHIPEILSRVNKVLKLKKDYLVLDFKTKLSKLKAARKKKKALVIIGESRSGGYLRDIRVAGSKTFYADILRHLGFDYAVENIRVEYPVWDYERLLKSKTDLIFRIGDKASADQAKRNWEKIDVAKAKLEFIFADYAVVPGPRILNLIEDIRSSYED